MSDRPLTVEDVLALKRGEAISREEEPAPPAKFAPLVRNDGSARAARATEPTDPRTVVAAADYAPTVAPNPNAPDPDKTPAVESIVPKKRK